MTDKPPSLLVQLRLERQRSGRLVAGNPASQSQIALLAGIDARTLRDIENFAAAPRIATLEAILGALDAFYPLTRDEKLAVWKSYQFSMDLPDQPSPLPDAKTVEQAIKTWQLSPGMQNYLIPGPAFLSDIGHRLLDYNPLFAKTTELAPDDPRLTALRGQYIYDLIFGFIPQLSAQEQPLNKSEYFPIVVTNWKYQLLPYRRESWYWPRIETARQRYPEFRSLWDTIPDEPPAYPPMRRDIPLMLRTRTTNIVLAFVILEYVLTTDPRLKIIHCLPADQVTRLQYQLWVSELEREGAGSSTITTSEVPRP